MTKEQWLNQIMQFDEWGRPSSLADVPLQYGSRKNAFKLRRYTDEEVDKLYRNYLKKDSK